MDKTKNISENNNKVWCLRIIFSVSFFFILIIITFIKSGMIYIWDQF